MASEIVERLNKADLYESSGDYSALSEEAASHIEALEARVRKLEGALRPFVPHKSSDFIDDDTGIIIKTHFGGTEFLFPAFKWSALRKARAALKEGT